MSRRVLFAVCLALAFGTAAALAQVGAPTVWNALASTGLVDEADLSLFQFNSTGSVAFRSGKTGTLDLRYNVSTMPIVDPGPPPDPEADGVGGCVALRAMLRDTGTGSRVIVRLLQMDLFRHNDSTVGKQDPTRANVRILGTIDSEFTQTGAPRAMASPNYFLFTECLALPHDFQFDNGQFAYFIEAQLVKSSSTANPGLFMVGVCNRSSGCDDN